MNFKIGTATQWVLVLCGVFAYGFFGIPQKLEFAIILAGVAGLWCGAVCAASDAAGKRDRYLIVLSLLLVLTLAWLGAKQWFKTSPEELTKSIQPLPPMPQYIWFQIRKSEWWPSLWPCWLGSGLLGWFTGFTAAMVQQGLWRALGFVAALGTVAVAIMPWSAVGLCALFGDRNEIRLVGNFFILSLATIVLLEATLLAVAGFRRKPRNRRAWLTLGLAAVLSLGIWGIAEGYYQWEVRQLRRQHPYRPIALTPEEQHTRELFQQTCDAEQAYNNLLTRTDCPQTEHPQIPGFPAWSSRPVPPVKDIERWLPESTPRQDGSRPQRALATEEYKEKVLAMDATEECNAFFNTFEQLLHEDHLVTLPDADNPMKLSWLSRLRSLAQWLVGRAQLRHYTGDDAGIIHYLDLGLRLGEVWPGDHTLISQLVRIAIDQIALNTIVTLGPDGPEYVDFYRDCLRRGCARRYEQISGPDYLASFWDGALAGQLLWTGAGQIPPTLYSWFWNPVTLRLLAQEFRGGEQRQQEFPVFRQQVADGIPLSDPLAGFSSSDRSLIKTYLIGEAKLQTGLALKLYRSLHGDYPETLQQLVPELLPVLPNDPETGKPLSYRKVENYFELGDSFRRTPLRPIADY